STALNPLRARVCQSAVRTLATILRPRTSFNATVVISASQFELKHTARTLSVNDGASSSTPSSIPSCLASSIRARCSVQPTLTLEVIVHSLLRVAVLVGPRSLDQFEGGGLLQHTRGHRLGAACLESPQGLLRVVVTEVPVRTDFEQRPEDRTAEDIGGQ